MAIINIVNKEGVCMKIFLDTADISTIKQWAHTGIIDGVTTNPTHLSKAGGDPKKIIKEICELLLHGSVSVEVTELDPDIVYAQAKAISVLADNITVKIPCHSRYFEVIKRLVDEDISLNITLIFTLTQGLAMCKLGVDYISPFMGRLDDIGSSGIKLVQDMANMRDTYSYNTELLAASIRSVDQLHEVILAGADIATVPVAVLEKAVSHPLTDKGIEKFLADWQALGIRKFP